GEIRASYVGEIRASYVGEIRASYVGEIRASYVGEGSLDTDGGGVSHPRAKDCSIHGPSYLLGGLVTGRRVCWANRYAEGGDRLDAAAEKVEGLVEALWAQHKADNARAAAAIREVLALACSCGAGEEAERSSNTFALHQFTGRAPVVWFELLVAFLIAENGQDAVMRLNPFLDADEAQSVLDLTAAALLVVNRVGALAYALGNAQDLLKLLRQLQAGEGDSGALHSGMVLKAESTAGALACTHHYIKASEEEEGALEYDPRFLLFEFTCNIMLRFPQVRLVHKFYDAFMGGGSMCHQLIMGAGKTTVVAPLLALLLGDGATCVFQVVPQALLHVSRDVMRERFSSLIVKPVYTFTFDRSDTVTEELYLKLVKAKESRAVVISHPTALKSFMLKFVEIVDQLDAYSIRLREDKEGKKKGGMFGFKLPTWAGGKGDGEKLEQIDTEALKQQ
ncbi:hypothetical protein CYMTET_33206, partial [Cymbomonas tetramitiformis]